MLNIGDKVPDFSLPADNGETISPKTHKGHPVVVYFYPKDDTPGCTSQAKDFSCLAGRFKVAGVRVIGISPDGPHAHAKFKTKHALSVDLASDEDHAVATAFGVWVEKSMYGKKYMGVERATYLIGNGGRIAAIWRKVKVPGHAEAVLAAAEALAR